ncbi:nucleotide-binding protein [Geopseudomonas aromaticivorans]
MRKGSIICITGGVGGTGKTLLAMALIDYLRSEGHDVLAMDGDLNCPQIYRSYSTTCETTLADFSSIAAWNRLEKLALSAPNRTIVVDLPVAASRAVGKSLHIPEDVLANMTVFWTIDRRYAAVETLEPFHKAAPCATHVVASGLACNGVVPGTLLASTVLGSLEAHGGAFLAMPQLTDVVADRLFNEWTSIEHKVAAGSAGENLILRQWRETFASLIQQEIGAQA